MTQNTEKLLEFISESPTSYQAVGQMKKRFIEAGYTELQENRKWKLEASGKYFVTRNNSAFIAFVIPKICCNSFHIVASHSDSPSFKIKENPEISAEHVYTKLNVEKYGGMLMSTWFDRPLSIAGRIICEIDSKVVEMPIHIKRDLLMIPNLAIHMNRKANEGYAYSAQKDMLPVIAMDQNEFRLIDFVANEIGIESSKILAHDLFLYNRMPGTVWGANEEFMSSPRLDDLQCAFSSMEAFLEAEHEDSIGIHCVMDNEEVGSSTKQGAASTFLKDTMKRIIWGMGGNDEDYYMALADSFMISADNAHAAHPNYPEKADPTNHPILNKGIVIKYNANQKYCTDSVSAARFVQLCKEAEVPYQSFTNHSDIAGGSTLGNISNTQAPMNTVDIGLPQWAMHSSYETAGVKDSEYLISVLKRFWR